MLKRSWVRFIAINLEQAPVFTRNLVPGRELKKFAFEMSREWEWVFWAPVCNPSLVTQRLVPSLNLEIQPFRWTLGLQRQGWGKETGE